MSERGWKLGTLAGAAASIFFALHPVRAQADKSIASPQREATAPARPSWVGWIGGRTEAPASPVSAALVARLRAASAPEEACSVLGELGTAGDEDATQAILEALKRSTRSQVRVCATDALGHVTSGEARSWLEELAGDHDADVRASAIGALAASDDPSARDVVLAIARDGVVRDRVVALVALAHAKVTTATPLIIALLRTIDVPTQTELVGALGASGDPAAVPVARL